MLGMNFRKSKGEELLKDITEIAVACCTFFNFDYSAMAIRVGLTN
jgi:hypothetical protein